MTTGFPDNIKKGALRRQLGIHEGKTIPTGLLDKLASTEIGKTVHYNGKIFTVTNLLKKRAVLARTYRGFK
jgi:hypothetical protein